MRQLEANVLNLRNANNLAEIVLMRTSSFAPQAIVSSRRRVDTNIERVIDGRIATGNAENQSHANPDSTSALSSRNLRATITVSLGHGIAHSSQKDFIHYGDGDDEQYGATDDNGNDADDDDDHHHHRQP